MIDQKEIRKARLALGLTQEQAGEVIGATRRAWQDWELGQRNMPSAKWELFQIKTRGKIMRYLIEIDWRKVEGSGDYPGWDEVYKDYEFEASSFEEAEKYAEKLQAQDDEAYKALCKEKGLNIESRYFDEVFARAPCYVNDLTEVKE